MTTPYQKRAIPAPRLNEGDLPYFEAASKGILLLKYCNDCQQHHHYPRAFCPFCSSENLEWREAKGTGEIYSFSVIRASGPVPYAIAYVTLDEGPALMTNIVGCDLDDIKCGQRVKVSFQSTDEPEMAVPMFSPIKRTDNPQ